MNRSVWAIAALSFIAGMLAVIVLIEIMKSGPTRAGVASIDSEQPVIAEVSLDWSPSRRWPLYRQWRNLGALNTETSNCNAGR